MERGESDLATDWEALPTGAIARGCLVKQPGRNELRQLKLGRLFNVASRPTTTRNLNLLPSGRNRYAPDVLSDAESPDGPPEATVAPERSVRQTFPL